MSKAPSHVAYVVIDPPEGSGKDPQWHKVGVVWSHSKGTGFDLVIPPGISVTGRITCIKPKPKADAAADDGIPF